MNESFVTFSDIFLKDIEWAFPFIKKQSEKKKISGKNLNISR